MKENNIICTECGTENTAEFEYCKNCGCQLHQNENIIPTSIFQHSNSYYEDYIDGISRDELEAFIGKKADVIIPHFDSMNKRMSNSSWCWATAVLSFLLGPLGAACWFIYRKLYEIAFVFLSIAIILTIITQPALSEFEIILNDVNEQLTEQLLISGEQATENEEMFNVLSDAVSKVLNVKYILAFMFKATVELVCLVISSISAYGWYKKHAVKTIYKYRNSNVDPRFYRMGLVSLGGTSGGMVVLCIVLYSFATTMISTIFSLINNFVA